MTVSDELIYDELFRIRTALEKIATAINEQGVLQMRDVDRAKVYSEHLGKKLSGENS